jgi:lipoprotein-anchoring transpeptidase ErfK/SrfK
MIRILAIPLALCVFAAWSAPVAAQDAEQAAEAAQVLIARAEDAFERIDPDFETPATDESTLNYAGLPPLTAQRMSEPVVDTPAPTPVAITSNDPFVIKSILPIEGTIRYGDWFWDESAAPKTGKLVITVDLDARVISAFRDGHEIGTAVALLGTRQHPTPLGTFPILTKEKDNVSEKYDNAPMPWTLRLTWQGVAIHGSPVLNGYASHGCVGVPDEFAAKLFAASKRGDKVIITRGKMVSVGDKVL